MLEKSTKNRKILSQKVIFKINFLKKRSVPRLRNEKEIRPRIEKERGFYMRLDKFLKVSRVIKRRPVANEACDAGRVVINGKVAKASTEVKIGDVVEIKFGEKIIKFEITNISDIATKQSAEGMIKPL